MRAKDRKAATRVLCALWLFLLPAAPARGHGEEEILLFAALGDEPNLLRISTALVGGVILLMGAFILRQARAEARRRERAPALKWMAPGLVAAGVGVAVLLAAAFVLPERIPVVHDHPARGAAKDAR